MGDARGRAGGVQNRPIQRWWWSDPSLRQVKKKLPGDILFKIFTFADLSWIDLMTYSSVSKSYNNALNDLLTSDAFLGYEAPLSLKITLLANEVYSNVGLNVVPHHNPSPELKVWLFLKNKQLEKLESPTSTLPRSFFYRLGGLPGMPSVLATLPSSIRPTTSLADRHFAESFVRDSDKYLLYHHLSRFENDFYWNQSKYNDRIDEMRVPLSKLVLHFPLNL